jgi:hypothetical protein
MLVVPNAAILPACSHDQVLDEYGSILRLFVAVKWAACSQDELLRPP